MWRNSMKIFIFKTKLKYINTDLLVSVKSILLKVADSGVLSTSYLLHVYSDTYLTRRWELYHGILI
jgi:hypothetical protein